MVGQPPNIGCMIVSFRPAINAYFLFGLGSSIGSPFNRIGCPNACSALHVWEVLFEVVVSIVGIMLDNNASPTVEATASVTMLIRTKAAIFVAFTPPLNYFRQKSYFCFLQQCSMKSRKSQTAVASYFFETT